MTAVVTIDNLQKTYRGSWFRPPVRAVQGISFEIQHGDAFGFIGPNGAGKSTTIKILIGAMSASAGRVEINGVAVNNPEARRGMGYVPESPYLSDCLTPLEVLLMGVRLHRIQVGDAKGHCMNWLDRFALAGVANRQIRTFSKGMTQRTALAHALAINPKFLVLDEPLSGLDPVGRRDVVDILAEYSREGGTLLFTSHVLHDVERVATRFGLIHMGCMTAVRSMSELVGGDDTVLVRSMGGRPVMAMREEFSGHWLAEVPRRDVWALLEAIRAANHELIEIQPRLTVENAFMGAIGESVKASSVFGGHRNRKS